MVTRRPAPRAPTPPDARSAAQALVAVLAECGDSRRLSLTPLFGGLHGYSGVHRGWFVVLESMGDGRNVGATVSPEHRAAMIRLGMLYAIGEGGDGTTVYTVDMRAVAVGLSA